jgi:hypothetical protein
MSKGRFEKTLRIGVRFDGTGFVLLDGQPLPKLALGAVAELALSPESIADQSARSMFSMERDIPFLGKGSVVMFGVSPKMLGEFTAGLINAKDLRIASDYRFIPTELQDPLFLRVRGDQEASLLDCDCHIPSLKLETVSLNHAFTRISEAYETLRRSHSGNVFDRAYALDKAIKWRNLDEHRTTAIAGLLAKTTTP